MREERPGTRHDKNQSRGYGAMLTCILYALKITFRHAPAAAGVYVLLSLTSSVCSVAQILFLQRLVDGVAGYVGDREGRGVLLWGSLYIAALAASSLYGFAQNKLDWRLRRRLTSSLTPAIAEKFSRIEYQYFENAGFQNVISRMSQNPQEKLHASFCSIVSFIMQAVALTGIMGIFFKASFWIGMGAALIGIPMSVLNIRAVVKQNRTLGEATMDQRMGEYQQNLFTDKDAAYEIKIFRAKDHILNMWQETMDRIFQRSVKVLKEVQGVQIFVAVLKIAYVGFGAVALTAGFLEGKIGLGVLVSVLQSVERLFSVMEGMAGAVSDLGKNTYEIVYFREFLGFAEDVREGAETVKRGGGIVFDHVCFKYPGTDREVLHDVSFRVESGESVALVGVNGAGKSTIVKLLCGLYRPDRGHIYIGGKDIAELPKKALRDYISVVFQDFGAYQLTLRENIALGDLAKIGEDDMLREALAQADSGELVNMKLDANLGKLAEDGVDLSGGQWQRIALSRAFLSRAEFVVLDEPTASLDPIAESRIYQSFQDMLEKRGSIIISHRLASARMAGRILVLEGGEIVESGSHRELMENGGLYAVMYEEQSGWYAQGV